MRPQTCLPCTKSRRSKRESESFFISMIDASVPISRLIIGSVALLSVLCVSGCVQDSPASSKERTVSLLLELLLDERAETRRTAVESLGKIGDPRTADSILPLMHDPAAIVREASVQAIGRVNSSTIDGITGLLTEALKDSAESVRQAAVVAIGDVEPGLRLLQPVVGLLKSSDVTIRRAAVQALLQVDSAESVPALVVAGRDPDAEVRQGVVAALGEWGGAAVSPWLRERLAQDPSPGVRAEAAYRLGMRDDNDTKAALETAVAKDTDSGVRRWAKRRT
jgi:HEAT repeat protein